MNPIATSCKRRVERRSLQRRGQAAVVRRARRAARRADFERLDLRRRGPRRTIPPTRTRRPSLPRPVCDRDEQTPAMTSP
jgi:hypothetical protein